MLETGTQCSVIVICATLLHQQGRMSTHLQHLLYSRCDHAGMTNASARLVVPACLRWGPSGRWLWSARRFNANCAEGPLTRMPSWIPAPTTRGWRSI